MARKKRSSHIRGRKSFERSYKLRRKKFNQYRKIWQKRADKYGLDNIGPLLDYKEFSFSFSESRKLEKEVGKQLTVSKFVEYQIQTSKKQSTTARDNFMQHIFDMREKRSNGGKISDYEKEMLEFMDANGGMTARDIRSKSWKYKTAYNIALRHDMGNEAFGS